MGGLTNSVLRALARLGLADLFGVSRVPIHVLNVVYPLVPEEMRDFCTGKRAVLVVEEGHPDYIEQAVNAELRRADIQTRVLGKGALPLAGEYTSEVLLERPRALLRRRRRPRGLDADAIAAGCATCSATRPTRWQRSAICRRGRPAFCTGCPERPVFAPSSSPSARSGRPISAPTSAAIPSRRCRRSTSATRSSATA